MKKRVLQHVSKTVVQLMVFIFGLPELQNQKLYA